MRERLEVGWGWLFNLGWVVCPGCAWECARVGCNEAVALIEETELLGRFEMQLLLEVLARAAAKLVEDVIISLAL
jgi:hypothetical protein